MMKANIPVQQPNVLPSRRERLANHVSSRIRPRRPTPGYGLVDPRISSMVNEEGQVSESLQVFLSTPKSRDSGC
jgi:hypothetical protein